MKESQPAAPLRLVVESATSSVMDNSTADKLARQRLLNLREVTEAVGEYRGRACISSEAVVDRIASGQTAENCDLTELDLAGTVLAGGSFVGSDVRGMSLYRPHASETEPESITDIHDTNWTNTVFASLGEITNFSRVEARGARFGFTQSLAEARAQAALKYEHSGVAPGEEESQGYFNFDGTGGSFAQTHWHNIDFGGATGGYEARFDKANLSGAVFEGCDLSEIDFSQTLIDNVVIRNPLTLQGMKIRAEHINTIVNAVSFDDEETDMQWQAELNAAIEERDFETVLTQWLGMTIVD